MIPKQLTLQNFLSYREVALNFAGLHVACVCGPNGAGKSSLLEAIAWCVWGQSRVSAEDDIVRQGAIEAQVSFCFVHGGRYYRIIRTRRRNQATALEFQIQANADDLDTSGLDLNETTFKSITQKGVRATQRHILQQIKIDYETFVNSAYLRQGRADEFMLKRPAERKQVLADLLKLDRYDYLAEQAKEQARSYKAQLLPIETSLDRLATQIESQSKVQQDYDQLRAEIDCCEDRQRKQKRKLKRLKKKQQRRTDLCQKVALGQQHLQHQQAVLTTAQSALQEAQKQQSQSEDVLADAVKIQRQYVQLKVLKEQESQQSEQFHLYQKAQSERLQYQQQLAQHQQQHHTQLVQLKAQLTQINQQEQTILKTLKNKGSITDKLKALRLAKKQLHQLDKSEAQSAPLRQRFVQIQGEIQQAHTRLATRLEALDTQKSQIATQQAIAPQLQQSAVEISHRLGHLEQRREYQEAVRQKGIERRNFMERLQANQLNCEVELAKFEQTLKLLEDPDEAHCPLCEQALNGMTWEALRDRTLEQRNDVQNQIWAIREQLAVSESEIQVLRREYRVLEEELANYAEFLEERGQLKAKLESADSLKGKLQAMSAERAQLERCLQENDYAEELRGELAAIETQLAAMDYDDRDHALVRSQVERLRWSELKHVEIKQAERALADIRQHRPKIEANIQVIQTEIEQGQSKSTAEALADVEQALSELDYSLSEHNRLRAEIEQKQIWQTQFEALKQAQLQQVALSENVEKITATCNAQSTNVASAEKQLGELTKKLATQADAQPEIVTLEAEMASEGEERDRQLSQLGRLQQQLCELETVQIRHVEQQKKLEDVRHKYQVYKSLSQAFGRNGIQALMIENLLPQLEAQTNQILSKLSDHQLHVQFVTQRTGRNRKKLIDTLDILIADARGTRPYETYSGGEAFRVNFSIRLAIARLLALRSGTALQMLIVDEGFGTQDRMGCDRLIAAIEAIAPDFACILTITHMPHFREAFQTRIDVFKDEGGSHITISE